MKLRPITGSGLHRAMRCPASTVLPVVVSDEREARLEPARNRGKAIHAYLERVKAVGAQQAIAEAPIEIWPLLKALDLKELPVNLTTEVALAYSWRDGTARELGRNLGHRDYDALPNPPDWEDEIAMTVDTVGLAESVGYAGDHKSGHTRYARPAEHGQLIGAGLAVRGAWGASSMVLEWTHIHDDGTHHKVRDVVDDWDLASLEELVRQAMQARLEALADRMAGRELAYREGDHCTYCPSFRVCQVKVGRVQAMPAELVALGVRTNPNPPPPDPKSLDTPGLLVLDRSAITVSNAAAAWMAIEAIEEVLGQAKSEICGLGWVHPIPLPDGRVIEPQKTQRRSVEGRKVLPILERRFGREAALEAIKIESSLDAIRMVVSVHRGKGEKIQTKAKDGVLDQVLDEIDRAGGLTTTVSETCKPHMPKKKLASGDGG